MIHHHCKISEDHYWGVGCTGPKPSVEAIMKHCGYSKKKALQVHGKFHDSVRLLVGAGFEQVAIVLTAEEARWIAEDLLSKAMEIEQRTKSAAALKRQSANTGGKAKKHETKTAGPRQNRIRS
jgi:hypothetical protein